MAQINPDIVSEIKGLQDTSKEVKEFLLWIVEFERGNMDKDHVLKQPIQDELKKMIGRKNGVSTERAADSQTKQ